MSNLLELHNISKSFGALTALRNLSFHISEGEVVGLLGDNGAGKSTTVNLISGIHKPTDGYLSVDGRKTLFTCRSDSADAGIETIYQHTALVDSLSITRNIFMGRELTDRFGFLRQGEMRDIAMEVLQNAVHISGIDSPDTLVGNLSGGQKQMVAMAQAFLAKPRFMIVDELSLGLAPTVVKRLAEALTLAAEDGIGVLLIEQFANLALGLASHALVMERGRIVFDGSSQTLRQQPDILHGAYLAE